MNFYQAMEYLKMCQPSHITLDLTAIKELLRRMGQPEKNLKIVHVGGTNGKGSTSALLSSILVRSGMKVGRYISPTIISYCERVQIEDRSGIKYITQESVASKLTKIRSITEGMVADGFPMPSPFEMETVFSFLEFVEQQCDIVVLEVGLGGRLDATNVIANKELSVLCAISRDHMRILGDTVAQITKEKVGIISNNSEVVCYDYGWQSAEGEIIEQIIEADCEKKNTTMIHTDFCKLHIKSMDLRGTKFDYGVYQNLYVPLLGVNQPRNAAVAIEAALRLQKKGYPITEQSIRTGLENTEWGGRFEVVSKKPLVIIDGAHNEGAAKVLRQTLENYFPKEKVIMIMGVFADKEYEKILQIMSDKVKEIYTITAPTDRGLPSSKLMKIAEKYCDCVIDAKEVEKALDLATTEKDEITVVCGSLSILNKVYNYYK